VLSTSSVQMEWWQDFMI